MFAEFRAYLSTDSCAGTLSSSPPETQQPTQKRRKFSSKKWLAKTVHVQQQFKQNSLENNRLLQVNTKTKSNSPKLKETALFMSSRNPGLNCPGSTIGVLLPSLASFPSPTKNFSRGSSAKKKPQKENALTLAHQPCAERHCEEQLTSPTWFFWPLLNRCRLRFTKQLLCRVICMDGVRFDAETGNQRPLHVLQKDLLAQTGFTLFTVKLSIQICRRVLSREQ